MKILHISPPWVDVPPKGYGGTENVIYGLIEALSAQGHEVSLFATGNSKTSADLHYVFKEGILNLNLPWHAALPSLVHYSQAFALAKAGDFDIIHTHLSTQPDAILWVYLSELNKHFIMTNHSHFPVDRYTYYDKYYIDYYVKNRNIPTVSISKYMQTELPKEFQQAGVVYNGLNIESYKFNPTPKGNYYTWVGVIIPDKGLHNAIIATKQAGEQFIFAGLVQESRRESVEYYQTKILPHIDGKQIQFLGPADLKLKNKLLSNAKGFLNPIYWQEPFGMVMVESMACGTPVISFNKGAAPEVIVHSKTGYIVENNSEMIDAMKKIDQNKISRLDCRTHVEQNFTSETSAQSYLEVYQKTINSYKTL